MDMYDSRLIGSWRSDAHKTNRYTILAKDLPSVALLVSNPIAGKQIVHIHFEGCRYWVILGSGRMREFFKRISSNPAVKAKKPAKSR